MQDHYNLLYREEEREMIPLCVEEGVGLVPWSPLARGRLARASTTPKSGTVRAENDTYATELYDWKSDDAVLAAVTKVAEEIGSPPADVALAWLLSRPGVAAPIVGASKIDQLETAVRALDVKLTPEQIARLEAPYEPHPVRGH